MRAFTVFDMPQHLEDGTANPEWLKVRLGRITGSQVDAMLAQGRSKGSESVQRVKLRLKLALERLGGRSLEREFQSASMAQGVAREPEAFALYEAQTGRLMDRTGFLAHDTLMAGASLDGHYGDFEGVIEIKCPEWPAHAATVRRGAIDLGYMRQIIHGQWLTGAAWTDFVSYNPDFSERLQLKVVRVKRNEDAIAQHDAEVRRFLDEVANELDELQRLAESVPEVA